MTGLLALAGHSLRRRRGLLVALALVLVVFQVLMVLTAKNYEETGGFRAMAALMPQFIAQLTNMLAMTFAGFVLFGYSHPILQLFLIAMAISIGTEPVAEIETRFVDLMMSRPLRRTTIIARTVVVLLISTLLAVGTLMTATFAALWLFAPANVRLPQSRTIVALSANLSLLVLAWGGIALGLGSFSKRRATAATICGFLAFTTFVLDYAGKFWKAIEPASRISPFHYFNSFALIGGRTLAAGDVIALTAMFAVSVVIACVVYTWRDL
jgi:ABC-type transport system involved in multi-copper enzyme maturation permease subunit